MLSSSLPELTCCKSNKTRYYFQYQLSRKEYNGLGFNHVSTPVWFKHDCPGLTSCPLKGWDIPGEKGNHAELRLCHISTVGRAISKR